MTALVKILQPDRDAWTKQAWESPKAFEAFVLYRDMGETRSIARVAAALGKSEGMIGRWSSHNLWQDRIDLYALHVDGTRITTIDQHRAKIIEQDLEMGQRMHDLAANTVDMLHAAEAGIPLEMVASFVQTASRLRRLAAGLSTENQRGVLQITTADFERVINRLVNGTAERFIPPEMVEEYLRWVGEEIA